MMNPESNGANWPLGTRRAVGSVGLPVTSTGPQLDGAGEATDTGAASDVG